MRNPFKRKVIDVTDNALEKFYYPMGYLTFSISCAHCKNRTEKQGTKVCSDCKCGIKSGFELKEDN